MGAAVIDGDAFAAFVRQHGRSLFGTAYLLTGDGGRAEDLVQDTLARLYPRWERVSAAQAPLAYVRRAVVNRFVSGQRRPSAREVALAELPERAAPGDLADGVTDRGMLAQLLRTLPERQRAALVLRYFHDLPDNDIAAALGCRAGTVRSLLSRGLEALRVKAMDAGETLKGGARS
jgi:RNA polymerase sigma-70 factor (sigma-E family)